MTKTKTTSLFWPGLAALALAKLLIHLYTQTTGYGLHRDEYLYWVQGDHPDWGFLEVPPLTPLLGELTRILFGDGMFGIRMLTILIGMASIFVLGTIVRDLGGRKQAQLIAGGAFLLSPAFLGSNNLFQPVSVNQFFWLLAAWCAIRVVQEKTPRSWYLFGLVAGLGFLAKYSIVFFLVAMAVGFLLSPHRKQLATPYPWIGVGIALLIASPNLYWQYSKGWPVIGHMEELARTQLVYMTPKDFLIPQLLFHLGVNLIWMVGLWVLFRWEEFRSYRFLGWTFVFTIGLLLATSGKAYYTIGAYSMLFAFGGLAWERWLGQKTWILLPVLLLMNLPIYPFVVPLLSPSKMMDYGQQWVSWTGIDSQLRWEDGVIRPLPQDFADMQGWEEIPEKVAQLYHSLSAEEKEKTLLYGGSYGHASVLNYYREKYDLPECQSFNSSFRLWVDSTLVIERQIQIDDSWQSESESFHAITFVDSITNPFARDPGYIFYKTEPTGDLRPVWKELCRDFGM